jgi:uncharacterized RDD family membrane protein YckC
MTYPRTSVVRLLAAAVAVEWALMAGATGLGASDAAARAGRPVLLAGLPFAVTLSAEEAAAVAAQEATPPSPPLAPAGQQTAPSPPEPPTRTVGPRAGGRATGAPSGPEASRRGGGAAGPTASETEASASDDNTEVTEWRPARPVVRVGQDLTVAADEDVSEVVVIAGSLTIDGRVRRDAVVVGGTLRLGPNARVGGSLVSIGTRTDIAPGAVVDRELVVIGAPFNAPAGFSPGGEQVVIGVEGISSVLQGMWPWLTQGLLLGRIIVPSLGWMWGLLAVIFFVYLVLGLLFERAVRSAVAPLVTKPLSTFLAGLLVFLLTGPAIFILTVSVVGIIVIPFALCALVVAGVIGKIAVARAVGGSVMTEDEAGNKFQAARSIAIGVIVLAIAYMIPILGIVTFMLVGVFALGAAWMALFAGLRRENPAKPKPPRPPQEPVSPSATPSFAPGQAISGTAPGTSVSAFAAEPMAEVPSYDSGTALPGEAGVAGAAGIGMSASLLSMPKASFTERAAAFFLDVVLVLLTFGILNVDMNGPRAFFLMLLIYHVAFWTMKGTTVGGMICNLRVIRTDGGPVTFGEATIRGLSSILSLAVLGLGALWILRDPERQAWHDTFAGTYVVKVPKHWRG